jgi:hypothetical protein
MHQTRTILNSLGPTPFTVTAQEMYCHKQQNATIHDATLLSPTANVTRSGRWGEPQTVFVGRASICCLWPHRSAALAPRYSYLWRRLEHKTYQTNHRTLEELRNIRREI